MADDSQEALAQAVMAAGVADARLIRALRDIPRASFVPEEHAGRAYEDGPIPIAHGQVTTQPSLSAAMVEALELTGAEVVLEVGSGLGFQTALLARLAEFVWSVERWPDLADSAAANLEAQGLENARVVVGDGSAGLREHAPFDSIIVSAAFPEVPEPLAEQLGPRGRLVQPIGPGGSEDVVLFEKRGGALSRRRTVTGAHFVPLRGRHGYGEGEDGAGTAAQSVPRRTP